MIEIAQMALSYYLNKRKDCFLKYRGLNDPESAVRARGAIFRTVKRIQMIQSAKREQNQRWNSLVDPETFYEWQWEFEIPCAVIKLPTVVM